MMHEECMHGDQEVLGEVTVALTRVAFETEKCMCSSYILGVGDGVG